MNNVDAIIYAKTLTNELEISGLFDPEVDLFLDKEFTYDEILKTAEENIKSSGAPDMSDEQLDEAIIEGRKKCFDDTYSGLIEKGILNVKAMDKNGEFICGLNNDIRMEIKKI